MLVLIYEDFRRDNEATVRRVLDFLDVADDAQIEIVETNASYDVRATSASRVGARREPRERSRLAPDQGGGEGAHLPPHATRPAASHQTAGRVRQAPAGGRARDAGAAAALERARW